MDSNNAEVIALGRSLVNENMTDMQRAKAIHDWVAGNIEYDYAACWAGNVELKTASATLEDRSGLCSGYSFLFAALCRAVDLPAKVIYGELQSGNSQGIQQHAWNQVMVDGKWITADTTWDSGYLKEDGFTACLSGEYFNPAPSALLETHKAGREMLY